MHVCVCAHACLCVVCMKAKKSGKHWGLVIEGLLVGGLVQTSSLYASEYCAVLKRNEAAIVFHREWIERHMKIKWG